MYFYVFICLSIYLFLSFFLFWSWSWSTAGRYVNNKSVAGFSLWSVADDGFEEDHVLDWILEQHMGNTMRNVSRHTLLGMVDSYDYLAVLFCKSSPFGLDIARCAWKKIRFRYFFDFLRPEAKLIDMLRHGHLRWTTYTSISTS